MSTQSIQGTNPETSTCGKCGADIRADSQFCYNCGGRLEPARSNGKVAAETEMKPAPGLRTARDIKRRERTFQRKTREVVWEPAPETTSAPLLIITAVVAIFTLLVIVFVFYFR